VAEKEATLILKLKDAFSQPISGVMGKLGQLKAGYLAVAAAVAGLASFLKGALEEYGKQQQAVAKLENALKNQGTASEGASQRLQDLASSLQKTTTVADETIIELQALLATFGFNEAAITKLIPRILDLSAATDIELRTATVALAKSIQTGSVGALQRYGIQMDEAAFKAKDFAAITAALDAKNKGAAQTLAGTYLGRLLQLHNSYSELKENLAKLLVGPATTFLKWLNSAVIWMAEAIPKVEKMAREVLILQLRVTQAALAFGKFIPGVGDLSLKMADALKKQVELAHGVEKTTNKVKDQIPAFHGAGDAAKEYTALAIYTAKTREQIYAEELNRRMTKDREWFDQNVRVWDAIRLKMHENATTMTDIWVGTVDTMVNSFSSGMADVLVNGDSFNAKMKDIGNQVLHHFVAEVIKKMVTEWVAGLAAQSAAGDAFRANEAAKNAAFAGSGGFGAGGSGLGALGGFLGGAGIGIGLSSNIGGKDTNKGGAAAGSVAGAALGTLMFGPLGGLAGGAIGGAIGGGIQRLGKSLKKRFSGGVINEPTMMFGMKSGQIGIAGERGVPEAIMSFPELGHTPESGRKALMGGGGGGGTVVININAGAFMGDERQAREMAKIIDKHLFSLSRNRSSVAL